MPVTSRAHGLTLSTDRLYESRAKGLGFFDLFHFHEQGRENRNEGEDTCDRKEVLEDRYPCVDQGGLRLLERLSNRRVRGQAIEALIPQADRAASPSAIPTIRDAVTNEAAAPQ